MKTYEDMLEKYGHLSFAELMELVDILEELAHFPLKEAGWSGAAGNWPLQDAVGRHMVFMEKSELKKKNPPPAMKKEARNEVDDIVNEWHELNDRLFELYVDTDDEPANALEALERLIKERRPRE